MPNTATFLGNISPPLDIPTAGHRPKALSAAVNGMREREKSRPTFATGDEKKEEEIIGMEGEPRIDFGRRAAAAAFQSDVAAGRILLPSPPSFL